MPLSASGTTAQGTYATQPTNNDPYTYQVGFGNAFASEALKDTLPKGQNMPQRNKYDLYMEGLTGSSFVAPRAENLYARVYRISPSVAHQGFKRLPDNPDLESCFLPVNPKVHTSMKPLSWKPFPMPSDSEEIDFVDGLKTVAGNGDPTFREGVAIHVFMANSSMGKKAFCNNDGDMLIVPQQGRLDIQTEFGKLMVRPGEMIVVQRGIKFKVVLPDGPVRGFIQEIYGSHYELPELGPLGSHGLANPRDFEYPVASFDIDQTQWQIVYKSCGELHSCSQDHTPFDVVAWLGNYAPYKYAMEKFVFVGSISVDHIDPSIYCVLTAKSKQPGIALTDFLYVGRRWDVSTKTFRPPYYHRNSSTEFIGIMSGEYSSGEDTLVPGSTIYVNGFCPHGVDDDVYKAGTEMELAPALISEKGSFIMFESSMMFTVTDYALKRSGNVLEYNSGKNLLPHFLNHISEINAALKAEGRAELGSEEKQFSGDASTG